LMFLPFFSSCLLIFWLSACSSSVYANLVILFMSLFVVNLRVRPCAPLLLGL
jgi:hypothetical protein